jgi:hypothetical protein
MADTPGSGGGGGGGSSAESLDLDSDEPTAVLSSVSDFVADDGKLGNLMTSFVFGIFASIYVGIGEIINSVVDFIKSPFDGGAEAITEIVKGLLTEPVSILEETAGTSATAISEAFGPFAFPVGVAVVLLSLYLVVQYLEQPETGDTFVGLPFDTPDLGPFEIGGH